MFLKRLEIQGFKSFADFVSFDFSKGVSAIVGPNGSGKSNVVDAVRWVLGEQSAKSLRGGKMEDVIFSGSKGRKPLGMAKVSLTLDNSQGIFDLPYNEVSVSRTLHRSGESLYHLNGKTTRLKDIQELFMDTGLGKDGFSVIGQGKIDEILTLHAEERRGLIEEAAGISKYKYRKKEASRKLESTRDDLTRLEDILLELESQLAPLEKQADDVRAFRAYDKEYRDLSLKLLKTNYDKLSVTLGDLEEKEKSLSSAFLESERLYEDSKEGLRKNKEAWQALRLSTKANEDTYEAHRTRYEALVRELEVLSERSHHQAQKKLTLDSETKRLEQKVASEKALFETFKENLEAEKISYEALLSDKAKKDDYLKSLEANKASLEVNLEGFEGEYFELVREEVGLKNKLQNYEERLNTLNYQKARQGKKESLLNEALAKKEKESLELERLYKKASEDLLALEEKEKDLEAKEEKHLKEKASLKEAHEMLAKTYTAKESRLATLNELESSGEGYFFGVSSCLKAKEQGELIGILGTVAQLIQVETCYEVAIENALGASLQHLVCEDELSAKSAINYLKAKKLGKATFLPLTTIRPEKEKPLVKHGAILGYANTLVTYEKRYHNIFSSLLGKTVIVRDLDSAIEFQKNKIITDRMVTLTGEVVSPKGSLTGGQMKKSPVLLKRGNEKRTLEEALHNIKHELAKKAEAISTLDKMLIKLHEEKMLFKADYQVQLKVYNEKLSLYESLKRESENEARHLKVEQADLLALEEEEKSLKDQEKEGIEALEEAKAKLSQLEERKKEKMEALSLLTEKLESFKAQYYEAEASLRYADEKYQGLLSGYKAKEVEVETLLKEKKDSEVHFHALIEELEVTNEKIIHLSEEKAQLENSLKENESDLSKAHEDLTSFEREIERLEGLTNEIRETYHKNEKRRNEVLVKKTQENERLSALMISLERDFELSLRDLEDVSLEGFLEKDARDRQAKLKTLIKDLGELNFTAIEAYEEVLERSSFMSEQLKDLKQAENQLLELIKEMEEVMSERFRETYAHVNALFNEIFQGMFHGGQARLELSMPKNYLETGIEIIAEPPGKRERILSLLSGGERAMTAIALLFALLNIKPSPFVILDEIEAALDEANVDHLADFIKNYSNKSQFIVISHRKGTMEASDLLYGVTMDKDGVSKLLSVRLEDYIESEV